jgi:HlyD family secretion protein
MGATFWSIKDYHMALPSFSLKILPFLAIGGIMLAAYMVFVGLPDRSMQVPDKTPPEASRGNGGKAGVAASGVIEPSSEITDIGTNVSGVVTEVYVQIGERVGKGTALFAVDNRQVRASLREADSGIGAAQAAIAEARTNMTTANRQLALYRAVDDARAISQSEVIAAEGALNDARARLQAAQAQLVSAQARRASAQTELARHIVYAPISGEVLDIEIRPGEFVAAGGQGGNAATPYVQLGETRPLFVRIDVDENEVSRIGDNANAIISPRGNSAIRVPVTLVRIEPQIVPKRSLTNSASERVDVRVMQIIFALPMDDANFRVGQQVDAVIDGVPQKGKAQ